MTYEYRFGLGALLTLVALLGGCGEGSSLDETAADYREDLAKHERVGTISFGSQGAPVTVRAQVDEMNLDRGAAWYSGSRLPGEGGLVYVAGHRTTHGAPFGPVASLIVGDEVTFSLPYAVATYSVTGRRLVEETNLSVLRANSHGDQLRLQTSTVPASSRRLLVFANLSKIRR